MVDIIIIIVPFLLLSGAIGFALGYLAQSLTNGKKADPRAAELYQQSERARKAMEEENAVLRKSLEEVQAGQPAAFMPGPNDDLLTELNELRAMRARFEQSQSQTKDFDYDDLAVRFRDVSTENASLRQEVQQLKTIYDEFQEIQPDQLIAWRSEIQDLRHQVAKAKEASIVWEAEKSTLEHEITHLRQHAANNASDPEKAQLRQRIEQLQRELVAASTTSEGSDFDRKELIALRALIPNLENEVKELRQRLMDAPTGMPVEQIAQLQQETEHFRIAAEEVPNLKEQIKKWKLECARLQGELEAASEPEVNSEDLGKLQQELMATRQAASSEIERLQTERERLESALREVRASNEELTVLQAQHAQALAELENLKSLNMVQSELSAELQQLRGERDQLREDRIAVARQRDQLQEELTHASESLEHLGRRVSELESRPVGPTPEQIAEMANLTAKADALQNELNRYRTAESEWSAKVDRAESIAVESGAIIANLEANLADRQSEREQMQQELTLAQDALTELMHLRQERGELAARVHALETTLGTINAERVSLENQIEAMRRAQSEAVVLELEGAPYRSDSRVAPSISYLPTDPNDPIDNSGPDELFRAYEEARANGETNLPFSIWSRRREDALMALQNLPRSEPDYPAEERLDEPTPMQPMVFELPRFELESPVMPPEPAPELELTSEVEEPALPEAASLEPAYPLEPEPESEPVLEPEPVVAVATKPKSRSRRKAAELETTTEADDLEEIIGIGPVVRKVLVEMGIDSYEKVARITETDLERVGTLIENFRERLSREKWREQAKVLYRMKYGQPLA